MARPIKNGLTYFPHDVDLSNDDKIEAMEALYGNEGYAFYLKLLERIYRNGDELKFSDDENLSYLAKKLNFSFKKFKSMLKSAFVIGLFDENAGKNGILTSKVIQDRYELVAKKRENQRGKYKKTNDLDLVSAAETPPKHGRNAEETHPETPERKEKKRKENESKGLIIIDKPKYDFDFFWDLYDKKVGDRKKIEAKWKKLTIEDQEKILWHIPKYKLAQPDKIYRKNPETYFNNQSWNDEIIIPNGTKNNDSYQRTAEELRNTSFDYSG